MNEFYNLLSTSAWKFIFWTLIHSNKYQGLFHPFNIVRHKLKIFIRQPQSSESLSWLCKFVGSDTTTTTLPTLPFQHRGNNNLWKVLYNVASYCIFPIKLHSCLSSFPNVLFFLSRWQVIAMPTLSLSGFIAVTDEPEANNVTPRPDAARPRNFFPYQCSGHGPF